MGFGPLDWYCQPVKHGAWSRVVENAFGAYTPCGIDTLVVCISYLVLFGVCFYRIWRTARDYTVQRFKLRSPYYNYLLGLLVVYCIAEPIYRIATGTSIMNLDGQPGLAPFEVRLVVHLISLPSRFFFKKNLMPIYAIPSLAGVKTTRGRASCT
jgi:ATP-binding cassette, subfamily C (CFTR/MRP), member 1